MLGWINSSAVQHTVGVWSLQEADCCSIQSKWKGSHLSQDNGVLGFPFAVNVIGSFIFNSLLHSSLRRFILLLCPPGNCLFQDEMALLFPWLFCFTNMISEKLAISWNLWGFNSSYKSRKNPEQTSLLRWIIICFLYKRHWPSLAAADVLIDKSHIDVLMENKNILNDLHRIH